MKRLWMVLRDLDENDSGGSSTTADATADSSSDTQEKSSSATEQVEKESSLSEVGLKAYEDSIKKTQPEATAEEEKAESGAVLSSNSTEKAEGEKEVADAAKSTEKEAADGDQDKGPIPYERFREVNESKKQFEERIKEYEPLVEAHKSVINFCQQNSISEAEFRQGLEFLRLTKSDPAAAKAVLQPIWDQLSGLTGDVLPADLQQEVADGILPEARAKEIARFRGQTKVQGANSELTAKAQEKAKQTAFVQELGTSIQSWSKSKAATDPSFKPKAGENAVDGKYEFVADRFYKLMAANPPKSSADAIKLIEQAYGDVSKTFASFMPRTAVASKGLSSTKSSTNSTKEPTSIKEVVANVLARHKA